MAGFDAHDGGLSPDIEKLAGQLAKDPRSRAFIPLAEEYAKAGMLHEAATVLEDGVKVYPTFVTALVALGRVYVQMEQAQKALGILQNAVKISPDNLLAHRILARLYVKQLSWDLARRSCERVLFEYPKDHEMLLLKSEIDAPAKPSTAAPALTSPAPPATPLPPDPVPQAGPRSTEPRSPAPRPVVDRAEPAASARPDPTAQQGPPVAAPQSAIAAVGPSVSTQASRPSVDPKRERLQSLLARIQARRPS